MRVVIKYDRDLEMLARSLEMSVVGVDINGVSSGAWSFKSTPVTHYGGAHSIRPRSLKSIYGHTPFVRRIWIIPGVMKIDSGHYSWAR